MDTKKCGNCKWWKYKEGLKCGDSRVGVVHLNPRMENITLDGNCGVCDNIFSKHSSYNNNFRFPNIGNCCDYWEGTNDTELKEIFDFSSVI